MSETRPELRWLTMSGVMRHGEAGPGSQWTLCGHSVSSIASRRAEAEGTLHQYRPCPRCSAKLGLDPAPSLVEAKDAAWAAYKAQHRSSRNVRRHSFDAGWAAAMEAQP